MAENRHYYAQQLFGGRPDPNLLFSTLIGDSYSYFYGSSKSASQIIRQNVTINALKEGSPVMPHVMVIRPAR